MLVYSKAVDGAWLHSSPEDAVSASILKYKRTSVIYVSEQIGMGNANLLALLAKPAISP